MKNPKQAIIPGILIGVLMLILLSKLLTPLQIVEAASSNVEIPETELAKDTSGQETTAPDCSLPSNVMEEVRQWCQWIEYSAAQYGVDPGLLAAVMTQESGGQAEVISASGAVGLMQVMPSDGVAAAFQCAGGPCFEKRPSTEQLLDPKFNIDYGTRMLAGLIERNGDVRDALMAYGPYNVGYYYADKVLAILASF